MSVVPASVASRKPENPGTRIPEPETAAAESPLMRGTQMEQPGHPEDGSMLVDACLVDASDVAPVVIDCDSCVLRDVGCGDCVVSVLLDAPANLLGDERAALEVLADAGLAPRLRLIPIRRGGSNLAS